MSKPIYCKRSHNPQGDICPRCETNKLHSKESSNALSRIDNETYVCSDCAKEEGLIIAGYTSKDSLTKEEAFKFKILWK